MPRSPRIVYGTATCRFYSRLAGGDDRCRVDTSYADPHYHTNCLGCGERVIDTTPADVQVLLDRARAAFDTLNASIENVRTVTGRPQSARATLARSNEARALIESRIEAVIAGA